jgi:putative hemolysin
MGLDEVFPGEDLHVYRTLGGLTMKLLGRVPQVGDRFSIGGFRLEVVDMDQNRVDKLLVTRADPPKPTAT